MSKTSGDSGPPKTTDLRRGLLAAEVSAGGTIAAAAAGAAAAADAAGDGAFAAEGVADWKRAIQKLTKEKN